MANAQTRRRCRWILAAVSGAVLFCSVVVRASVPARNADYSMYDFQFNRVGDTKLDNEVTDCGLVKHQFQRGYIRLREYLERMQGCGRQGKMKNIEGIAKSTVEDLRNEAMAEIAKAATEGLHFDPQPAQPSPPPKPATTPTTSAPAAGQKFAAATGNLKVQTSTVDQTGTQRSFAARPVTTPYQQGQVPKPRMPFKKTSVAAHPAPGGRPSPFRGLNQIVQALRNYNNQNPLQQLSLNLQGGHVTAQQQPAITQGGPVATQQLVSRFQGGPVTAQQPPSITQGGPVAAQQVVSSYHGKPPTTKPSLANLQRGPATAQVANIQGGPVAAPRPNIQGGPVTAAKPNLQGGPVAKFLTQSPVANAQASFKSQVHNEHPGISVGNPLYKPAPAFHNSPAAQRPQMGPGKTGGFKKQSAKTAAENVDDADETGVTDEALDDSRAVNNPDKDIDDEAKADDTLDKEPSDMPMPGVDDDTADEGTHSVDVDDSRAGMGRAKQKTAGTKTASAGVQNPAARQQNPVNGPQSSFGLPVHAGASLSAGPSALAQSDARIQQAVATARGRARARLMGRVGGAVNAPQNNVITGPARVLANPGAPLRNAAAPNRMPSAAAAQTRHGGIDLDVLKNKIMHTTNATYLRHMLQLIRQITHHRDFQKLQGPARAFVDRANTAVQALSKAYSQRLARPVARQPYPQPQQHAAVVKKFQIARNPYYALQRSYYRVPYQPPYYALQRMQYGWYNGNTP